MVKNIRITLATFFLAFMVLGAASAQNSDEFRRRLAEQDTLSGGVVVVTENGRAAEILKEYNTEYVKDQTIPGYRVRIFFANNQTARRDAMAVQEKFRSQFPEIPTYLVYETPSFMVTVGNCMNMDEALILLGRVSKRYRSAFLWRGDIPVDEFLKVGDETDEPEEESAVQEDGGVVVEG